VSRLSITREKYARETRRLYSEEQRGEYRGWAMTGEGIRKITDISAGRLEDTKGNGGLQKVVKTWQKRGTETDRERQDVLFYDEKLHNVKLQQNKRVNTS
jgi:hypothetical protein